MDAAQIAAMRDELDKLAASKGRWAIPQSRGGRRPMSVSKMLSLEAAGKLFRKHAEQRSDGTSYVPSTMPEAPGIGAKASKKRGDVASPDSDAPAQFIDGRGEATTISPNANISGLSTSVGQVERSW